MRKAARWLAGIMLVAACSSTVQVEPIESTTQPEVPVSTTATEVIPTTTTTTEAAPSIPRPGLEAFSDVSASVLIPAGDPPFPAVVTVHGGQWQSGSPEFTVPIATYLRDEGYLVFNTKYQLASAATPGFPAAVNDVACAVRLAAHHELSDGTVTVIGMSSGAHLAALVATTGDQYGGPCPELDKVKPDRLIALGLPDVTAWRQGVTFVGASPEEDPDRWIAADPLQQTNANPDLRALFIHAENDGTVSINAATRMIEGLHQAGAEATLEKAPNIRHLELLEPKHVGEIILNWLKS